MISTSNIWSVVLIIGLAHVVDNSLSYSHDSDIKCDWNCSVHEADLTPLKREMKTSVTLMIKLGVRYQKVDDKCANETSVNASEYASNYCQVCLVNKRLFPSVTLNKSLINVSLHIEPREIHAICTLTPAKTTVSILKNNSSRPSAFCHHINFEAEFDSIGYHAVGTDKCVNFTISDKANITEGALVLRAWPKQVLVFFYNMFFAIFFHYSLAFLCLFYPTEILQDGVPHIILEGVSPVSLRSLAGNYFFSKQKEIWHKTRKFFLRVFVIPLPLLLISAISSYCENSNLSKMLSYRRLTIAFVLCYCIQAFYTSFCLERSTRARPCLACKFFKPTILSCQDELPQQIINHLRLQPLIFVECWRIFNRRLVNYLKTSASVIPSCSVSIVSVLRLLLFITLLLCIPVVIVVLLIMVSILAILGIMLTTPVAALSGGKYRLRNLNPRISISSLSLMHGILSFVSFFALCMLLKLAAFGSLNAVVRVFALSYSEEHLPYVACFVFVFYYVWTSYSSFTKAYHELSLALFHCNKISRSADQLLKLPITPHELDNMMAIPKELFDRACEELMPLRERVCILILEITLLVSSVLIVFSLIMKSSSDTTPLMKTLLTFLTLSFPKIVTMYGGEGWQKKLRATVIEEKVPKIMENFIRESSKTNRGHEQRDINVKNDEVILVNEDYMKLATI